MVDSETHSTLGTRHRARTKKQTQPNNPVVNSCAREGQALFFISHPPCYSYSQVRLKSCRY
jgi:hypothetical protein